MSYPPTPHTFRLALAAALLTTLTACGGGGSDAPDLPCGGGNPLSITITYEVNGVLVDPNRPVILPRDVPSLATPRIVGLPAACNGAAHLSVTTRTLTSPTGMGFDAKTGVVSGTATTRGFFNIELKVEVDGYIFPVFQTIDFFM